MFTVISTKHQIQTYTLTHTHTHLGVVVEIAPKITEPPVDTSAGLYNEVVLTCLATGSPQPAIKWYKNGARLFQDADVDSPTLIVPEMSVADRGFYYCMASNRVGSVVSDTVVLNIDGMEWITPYCIHQLFSHLHRIHVYVLGLVQYEGILQLSENFHNTKRKRQDGDQIQELLTMVLYS